MLLSFRLQTKFRSTILPRYQNIKDSTVIYTNNIKNIISRDT